MTSLDGADISNFRDLERFDKIATDGEVYDKNASEVAHIKETNLFVDMNAAVMDSPTRDGVVRYYWPKKKRILTSCLC